MKKLIQRITFIILVFCLLISNVITVNASEFDSLTMEPDILDSELLMDDKDEKTVEAIVAAAEAEYEYFQSNKLTGGTYIWDTVREYLGWTLPGEPAWCAAFVCVAAARCGYLEEDGCFYNPNAVSHGWFFGCDNLLLSLMECGAEAHMEAEDPFVPMPGDIVFFTDEENHYVHVGIVEQVDEQGCLHTIEGNVLQSIVKQSYSGYGLGEFVKAEIGRWNLKIGAYLRPNYPTDLPEEIAEEDVTQIPNDQQEKPSSAKRDILPISIMESR